MTTTGQACPHFSAGTNRNSERKALKSAFHATIIPGQKEVKVYFTPSPALCDRMEKEWHNRGGTLLFAVLEAFSRQVIFYQAGNQHPRLLAKEYDRCVDYISEIYAETEYYGEFRELLAELEFTPASEPCMFSPKAA